VVGEKGIQLEMMAIPLRGQLPGSDSENQQQVADTKVTAMVTLHPAASAVADGIPDKDLVDTDLEAEVAGNIRAEAEVAGNIQVEADKFQELEDNCRVIGNEWEQSPCWGLGACPEGEAAA
jgi:hypothetical protein